MQMLTQYIVLLLYLVINGDELSRQLDIEIILVDKHVRFLPGNRPENSIEPLLNPITNVLLDADP